MIARGRVEELIGGSDAGRDRARPDVGARAGADAQLNLKGLLAQLLLGLGVEGLGPVVARERGEPAAEEDEQSAHRIPRPLREPIGRDQGAEPGEEGAAGEHAERQVLERRRRRLSGQMALVDVELLQMRLGPARRRGRRDHDLSHHDLVVVEPGHRGQERVERIAAFEVLPGAQRHEGRTGRAQDKLVAGGQRFKRPHRIVACGQRLRFDLAIDVEELIDHGLDARVLAAHHQLTAIARAHDLQRQRRRQLIERPGQLLHGRDVDDVDAWRPDRDRHRRSRDIGRDRRRDQSRPRRTGQRQAHRFMGPPIVVVRGPGSAVSTG